jgi:hypothetical protein
MVSELEVKWRDGIDAARAVRIADKKERRSVRHGIQARARKMIQSHNQGLCCTNRQLRANSKLIADRYFKAQSEMR